MKQTPLFIIALIVVSIGGLSYLWMKRPVLDVTDPTASPEIYPIGMAPTGSQVDILAAGGSSYRDPDGLFVFLYPNDYVLDTQDPQHVRVYKRGETQTGQTEMFDGVIVVFENVDLGGKTLERWVDDKIQESTADGTLTVIEPKKAVTLNGFPGISYATRGLGESKNVIVQKDAQSPHALVITYSVSDPEGKDYQGEVDAILSHIELLK